LTPAARPWAAVVSGSIGLAANAPRAKALTAAHSSACLKDVAGYHRARSACAAAPSTATDAASASGDKRHWGGQLRQHIDFVASSPGPPHCCWQRATTGYAFRVQRAEAQAAGHLNASPKWPKTSAARTTARVAFGRRARSRSRFDRRRGNCFFRLLGEAAEIQVRPKGS
jgi:hypothetical protein